MIFMKSPEQSAIFCWEYLHALSTPKYEWMIVAAISVSNKNMRFSIWRITASCNASKTSIFANVLSFRSCFALRLAFTTRYANPRAFSLPKQVWAARKSKTGSRVLEQGVTESFFTSLSNFSHSLIVFGRTDLGVVALSDKRMRKVAQGGQARFWYPFF